MRLKTAVSLILLFIIAAGSAFAGPAEIPDGLKCHLCGMKVNPSSPYSAQAVQNGEMLPFCDIGDMLYFYNKQEVKPSELYVRNMSDNGWIAAEKALYVKDKRFETPMDWGIAAFSDREEAEKFGEPMDFSEALNAVK